jgi:UDP-N-acetylglucosamine 2-epimerase (non-hydrolysing)
LKVLGVSGARPNFMKIDPVLRALDRDPERFETVLVHTGQHYDEQMSKIFFRDLGMREPEIDLGVGSGSHAEQTGRVMIEIEKVLHQERPDLVVVVGDVNSTLAAAVTAAKLCIPVAHVEAGLRSRDRTMPEEINRLVTDTLSDLLFTPSPDGDENLAAEGIPEERIHLVGNVMIDSLQRCLPLAEKSEVTKSLGLQSRGYALLTLHRPSNVDDPQVLKEILDALDAIQERMPVVFPVHPRTRKQVRDFGLGDRIENMPGMRLLDPVGYLDFLALQAKAALVLTDSGGVQEETTVLGVPCLTLRHNTERPVTVTQGTNRITGPVKDRIVEAASEIFGGDPIEARVPDLWDGKAAERIADVLRSL